MPFIARISLLLKDIVSCRLTFAPGLLWKPPPVIETLSELLGIVYATFPVEENVTIAVETGNLSWSYVPVARFVLASVLGLLSAEIMSTVVGDLTNAYQPVLFVVPNPA